MPSNFELQTICVILMVNENWFHSNIGCGGEFNLFAGFVYLFSLPFSVSQIWAPVFAQDKHKISIVCVCRHQWRSNKLTNLFWLFSDNVVGCHMSSTTAAAFSENWKCELYFSVSRAIYTSNAMAMRTKEQLFEMFCVLVYHLVRGSVAVCVCVSILRYFHFRWSCCFSFFLFLLFFVLRWSFVQIHFSILFVVHYWGDVHETHKHTY